VERANPPGWQVWTALWIVYVLWGSTYLAIAFVVESMPAATSAAIRFGVAAVLLAGWVALRRGRSALRVTARQVRAAAVVGLLLLLGGNGMVVLAEDAHLPTGLAALLIAAVPFWVVLLRLGAGDRPAWRTLLGVALGFVGVAVLLLPGARPDGVPLGPAALVVLGSFLWSVGMFSGSRLDLPGDRLMTTALQMAAGSLGLLVVGLLRGERLVVGEVTASAWLATAYLVVFGSLVAFTAYSWLLTAAPVSKVATYAYVNPVVAVGLGALVLGEELTAATVVGGAVTLAAVAVVVREEGRARRAEPVPADDGTPVPSRR
jgi:drug/metabolite transporter (DMT)-like permease